MKKLFKNVPSHIKILNFNEDSYTALVASDVIITIFGTVGFEAASQNKIVINADHSHYKMWRISYTAKSKAHYKELLTDINSLNPPDENIISKGSAVAYFSSAPHPQELGFLRYVDDSNSKKFIGL